MLLAPLEELGCALFGIMNIPTRMYLYLDSSGPGATELGLSLLLCKSCLLVFPALLQKLNDYAFRFTYYSQLFTTPTSIYISYLTLYPN